MPLKICAVTGSRADYNYLAPVMDLLRNDPAFDLTTVVTGQHLATEGRESLQQILNDGFSIFARVPIPLADDSARAIAHALGTAVMGLADALSDLQPDLVLILGDRYEILAAAQAALLLRIPIAHIGGGDVTIGAFDDSIRHSVSKISHLHFVSHEDARERLIAMGEQPSAVFAFGSPSIDYLMRIPLLSREQISSELRVDAAEMLFIVTLHPTTLSNNSIAECRETLAALAVADLNATLIFTGVNADPGGREIRHEIMQFCSNHPNARYHESLGPVRYYSAMAHAKIVIGNSSSGLYEAPSFKVPTVNIGDRQTGRPRAASVIDCSPNSDDISGAIRRALALDCAKVTNPFGDGHAAERICRILRNLDAPQRLLRKVFYDQHAA
jgi:UDP-hydrolysing UDP-N-acetyl-D-glucosamine 2-epimerase